MAEILVLDDVADAGRLLKRVLGELHHVVHPFSNEEEALDHVRTHPVDLAILDIKLKKMSGVDVLREIKRISPSTKAIMLTGYPSTESARDSQRYGAQEYCTKPIDNEELIRLVHHVLGSGT